MCCCYFLKYYKIIIHKKSYCENSTLYMLVIICLCVKDTQPGCKIFVSICGYIGAIDVDKIDLDDFVEALARFGDIRTHDGMVSLPKRLNAFFSNVNVFFEYHLLLHK